MSWDIVYTAAARRDLRDIYEYIAYELLVPETAAGQTQRIMKEIRALDEMPMRFRLYEEEPWHSEGLRFFPVDNYLVFYLPDETRNTVSIVRIMYGGRDIPQSLTSRQGGQN
jgi:toxin ParE1/3/4